MTGQQEPMLDVYLQEYEKLKDEQVERIGFRDNLLYFTLGIYGAVLALALGEQKTPYALYALLILPWVSLILGWTYLVNDQKITAIGRYIRYTLVEKVSELTGTADEGVEAVESIFGWEIAHRSDKRRKRRKLEQLIIDEIAFVASGIMALFTFWQLVPLAGKAQELVKAQSPAMAGDLEKIPFFAMTNVLAKTQIPAMAQAIGWIELILLVWLGIEIFIYADLAKGR